MDDPVKNTQDDNILDKELRLVEQGGYAPPGITENLGGSSVEHTDPKSRNNTTDKKEGSSNAMADAFINDAKALKAIAQDRMAEHEEIATANKISTITEQLKKLTQERSSSTSDQEEEIDTSITKQEGQLEALQKEQEKLTSSVPKDKIATKSASGSLLGSAVEDARYWAQFITWGIKHGLQQRRADSSIDKAYKAIKPHGLVGIYPTREQQLKGGRIIKLRVGTDKQIANLEENSKKLDERGIERPAAFTKALDELKKLKEVEVQDPDRKRWPERFATKEAEVMEEGEKQKSSLSLTR